MRAAVARTARPEVVGGIGGFAGLFDASRLAGYRRPLLATATDGVGTKVVIAQRMGRYDTVGIDLVAMVVDDLVACGAEPLFMTDYVVCGALRPERVAAIVGGVAEGCVRAGCALIGGETAEHPGHFGPDDFDLAGAATGVVEADRAARPGPGQARRCADRDGVLRAALQRVLTGPETDRRRWRPARAGGRAGRLDRPLGDELLTPTRIYAPDCLALADGCDVHAFAHITGGGLAANLSRVLPPGADATIDRGTWRPPAVFGLLAAHGGVRAEEMEQVFNMGVGMVAVVGAGAPDGAEPARRPRTARMGGRPGHARHWPGPPDRAPSGMTSQPACPAGGPPD